MDSNEKNVRPIGELVQAAAAGVALDPQPVTAGKLGQDHCPDCGGFGYVRLDLPLGHPDFGQYRECACRAAKNIQRLQKKLFAQGSLAALGEMTFEAFEPRGRPGIPLEQADSLMDGHYLATRYAKDPAGWLTLQGGFGCGKTHLAAAVANSVTGHGLPALFFTVPDLLDALRSLYDSGGFDERFEEIKNIYLLVLDDFGTEKLTPWAQEKLYQLMNHRYLRRLPTVITTNVPLERIEGRIRSRILDTTNQLATIDAPDYRQGAPETKAGAGERIQIGTFPEAGRFTFSGFDLRERESGMTPESKRQLQPARDVTRRFAEDPNGWLLLMGESRTGKTHLLGALADGLVGRGHQVVCTSMADLLDYLRDGYGEREGDQNGDFSARLAFLKSAQVLVIDDFSTRSGVLTSWGLDRLFQILNHRFNNKAPTVVACPDNSLESIEPRLRSRFMDVLCHQLALSVEPYKKH